MTTRNPSTPSVRRFRVSVKGESIEVAAPSHDGPNVAPRASVSTGGTNGQFVPLTVWMHVDDIEWISKTTASGPAHDD